MDQRVWWATVHRAARSQTWLKWLSTDADMQANDLNMHFPGDQWHWAFSFLYFAMLPYVCFLWKNFHSTSQCIVKCDYQVCFCFCFCYCRSLSHVWEVNPLSDAYLAVKLSEWTQKHVPWWKDTENAISAPSKFDLNLNNLGTTTWFKN